MYESVFVNKKKKLKGEKLHFQIWVFNDLFNQITQN